MNKIISRIGLSCCTLFIFSAIAQQTPATSLIEVAIVPKARAMSPVPPANAKRKQQADTIGEGGVRIRIHGRSKYWEEESYGSVDHLPGDVTAFLHDARRGILYAYRHGDFACKNDRMNGRIVEALYTPNNSAGREAGSGWYVAQLDAGDCGVKQPGLYGCKFTEKGQYTECGRAKINRQNGDIDLTATP